MSGLFISFEGIEGSGKTTQIQSLRAYLADRGVAAVVTKEPGGTDMGMALRDMILDPQTTFHSMYTELLLFFADRLEHVAAVIKPALAAGQVVICDRYMDSTIAYQIAGREMPHTLVDALDTLVALTPDITFLLDINPEEGLRRAKARAALDRFEQEASDFHHRVRDGYLAQARRFPKRIQVIDVNRRSKDQVASDIQALLPYE